jgi:xanthine dehydrogenase accessory factor
VLGYLADRGLPADQLGRVHVPAGLDLGHTTHQEIAVAILAELVQLRASGALAGAPAAAPAGQAEPVPAGQAAPVPAGQAEPVPAGITAAPHAPAAQAEPAEAVDPVCGMTVAATTAGRPLAHDGVTYHFCSTSCRRKFELDPAAYATRETRC